MNRKAQFTKFKGSNGVMDEDIEMNLTVQTSCYCHPELVSGSICEMLK